MVLSKRYYICEDALGREVPCSGFWYTDKGIIIKWIILAVFFSIFMLWFVGGYIHARKRLRAGQPLLGYHRFLVSYSERKRYGQAPQNHFSFYTPQQYANQPYQQRQDGTWSEPPPLYMNNDAPPQYYPPPAGASKASPTQGGPPMEMPQYGVPVQGQQQSGFVAGAGNGSSGPAGDIEQGVGSSTPQELPPRPPQAKTALKNFVGRFRK